MRTRGLIIVGVAVFFALFVPSYPVQWIGYFGLLVAALSYGYARLAGRSLEVRREEHVLRAFRHQVVAVRITVANRGMLPLPYLFVADQPGSLYTGNDNARLMSLRAGETLRLEYRIRAHNRGAYRIGPVDVRFSDPLGLFPAARTYRDEARLIVYPTVYPVHLHMRRGLPAGRITTTNPIYEDPTRFRSVREYTPGDELRRINWKVSARFGALHSTVWLPTLNAPVMILLNLTASAYVRRHRYAHTERVIDAAASLAHELATRGQEVGLMTTGLIKGAPERLMPHIRVGAGMHHAVEILETLAQLTVNDEGDDPTALFLERGSMPHGTRLFYLGAPLPADGVAMLAGAVHDASLVQLYYLDEGVHDRTGWECETVPIYRITEYGDEILAAQA